MKFIRCLIQQAFNIPNCPWILMCFEAGGGLGFAWRHWDWLTLYYKHSVPKGSRFFGTSLTYYFSR